MDWRIKLLKEEKYSDIFVDTYQFEPPLGWKDIVENLVHYIHWHNKVHNTEIKIWRCVKESGGLRFHIDTQGFGREGLEEIFGAIQFAEMMANSTCEMCGSSGELHKFHMNSSLELTTLCYKHFQGVAGVETID